MLILKHPSPTVPHALVDWIIEKDRAQYAKANTSKRKGTSMQTASIEECVRRCILSQSKDAREYRHSSGDY